jgi:hypothetical protein
MKTIETIDWQVEQDRFMRVAYSRTVAAAHVATRKWNWRTREDGVAEFVGKVWDQWSRLIIKNADPEPMLGPLIHWAKMWVRYDRKIGGRGRNPDVFDYRAKMTRQHLDAQGKASPTDRSDSENGWIDWELESGDDPAEMIAALENVGMTIEQYLAA